MYTRKQFIKTGIIAGTGLYFSNFGFSNAANTDFISNRPSPGDRKFTSDAVEEVIIRMRDVIKDKQLSWLFENCFPNTLDTTVDFEYIDRKPDTYVITGDIDAMWLRDSTAQVWPYLPLITKIKNCRS